MHLKCFEGADVADALRRVREELGALISASASEIAFVANTSQGVIDVAFGIPWRKGDRLLLFDVANDDVDFAVTTFAHNVTAHDLRHPSSDLATPGGRNQRDPAVVEEPITHGGALPDHQGEDGRVHPIGLAYLGGDFRRVGAPGQHRSTASPQTVTTSLPIAERNQKRCRSKESSERKSA